MLFRDQLKRAVSLTEEDFAQLGIPVRLSAGRADPTLDGPMILFQYIVEISHWSMPAILH
jgi:hypothetical protein